MSLKIIEPNKAIQDAVYVEDYEFACGKKVPIYQVNSIYALTQVIGYVKYINASYGSVLYRGQCKLYKTIEPSIYHGIESTSARSNRNQLLNIVIDRAINDEGFAHFMKLDNSPASRTRLESVMESRHIMLMSLTIIGRRYGLGRIGTLLTYRIHFANTRNDQWIWGKFSRRK